MREEGLKIGSVALKNRVALAPMAGVTDLPFRLLCREQGCGLVCTEMVSAKALLYKNRNTKPILETGPGEDPVAVQLFGSDPDIMSEMALQLEEGPYALIDVNMGCPVPKIVNNGEGSALMRNPRLAGQILTAMVKKLHKPVTVKFRKGFDEKSVNAVEFAKMAESCGVAAVAVHGRTREQYYSGRAWERSRRKAADHQQEYRQLQECCHQQVCYRQQVCCHQQECYRQQECCRLQECCHQQVCCRLQEWTRQV